MKTAKTNKTFKRNSICDVRKNFAVYTMFIPGFLVLLVFNYIPFFGLILPFKKISLTKGIWNSPWVGLKNFRFLFSSSDTFIITRNTLCYNLAWIFIGLVLAILLAICLSLVKNKLLSKTYQTIFLMPHFLSMVIVAYLVLAFLKMENGYINEHIVEGIMGKEAVNWYTEPNAWPYILTIVNIWKTVGYNSIVYLAAIAGIDSQLYEAASIDGAGTLKKIRYITIPSLKSLAIILTILNIGKIFNADFGLFYQVTQNSGALYPSTYVINTYTYNMLTGQGAAGLGLSSAAAFYQSVVGFILVLVTNAVVRKIDPDSALF